MGIGYKTSWLAVQDAAPEEVADALGLRHRRIVDWTGGTSAAYRQGVFVARPVPDWTIAHSRIHLPPGADATDPGFPLHIGEPSDVERELGVGQRWLEEGWQDWQEPEWDAWFDAMPGEDHVMRIAQNWSICPLDIPDCAVSAPGIYGFPSGVEPCYEP